MLENRLLINVIKGKLAEPCLFVLHNIYTALRVLYVPVKHTAQNLLFSVSAFIYNAEPILCLFSVTGQKSLQKLFKVLP